MNDDLKTEFFCLLVDNQQEVTSEKMKNAYGNFIKHVEMVCSENDYAGIHRNLNITRIELSALEPIYRYEQGKKCPEISLSAKSLIFS